MRSLILSLIISLLISCTPNKEEQTKNDIDSLRDKRNIYVQLIRSSTPYGLNSHIERCDRLTFVGLFDSFGSPVKNLYSYEYPQGKWNRDVSPCYPQDSRSEISLEGMLGALHALITRSDYGSLESILVYGDANGWVMGEGPLEYTFMPQIKNLIKESLKIGDQVEEKGVLDLSGYKAHVIADYIYLYGRVHGKITKLFSIAIKNLKNSNPNDPVFNALYHRFKDGDQSEAISMLLDESKFPSDRLPEDPEASCYWQGMPPGLCLIYATAIIEGS